MQIFDVFLLEAVLNGLLRVQIEIAVSVVAELIAKRRGAQHPNSLSVTNAIADKLAQ